MVFAVTYSVRIGPVLILGIGPERLRQAVLRGAEHGGTLHTLIGLLGPMDYVRIGLYGLLLAGIAALVVCERGNGDRLDFCILSASSC
jgi:hypothetical protein